MKWFLKANNLSLVIFLVYILQMMFKAFPLTLSGVCEKVLDGDTIIVSGKVIRLIGIDAPEKDQLSFSGDDIGERSLKYLRALILGKNIKVKYRQRGRYGRILGEIYFQGENINLKLLEEGMAVRYMNNELNYIRAEFLGRVKRSGIFKAGGFYRPGQYRRLARTKY